MIQKFATLTILTALAAGCLNATNISVNVKFGNNTVNGADLANFSQPNGVYSSNNWNLIPADDAGAGMNNLLDSEGNASGLSLTSSESAGGANASFDGL